MNLYYIYMLKCSNGSYYTGYTVDLKTRYQKHLDGTASKYTRSFKPVKIAACWTVESDSPSEAMKIEAGIKKLSSGQKVKLVGDPSRLKVYLGIDEKIKLKTLLNF